MKYCIMQKYVQWERIDRMQQMARVIWYWSLRMQVIPDRLRKFFVRSKRKRGTEVHVREINTKLWYLKSDREQ